MMSKSKDRFLSLLLLVFVAFAGVPRAGAQASDKEKAEQEAAKREELTKNTLKLLDEVASEAASLRLRENRTYVLTTAADLLWSRDEKRARTLFWAALGSLNLTVYVGANLPEAKNENTATKGARANGPTKEQAEELNKYYARIEARHDFLQTVARHDAQLALDMMRSTRQGPPQFPGAERFDPEGDLEQELTFAAAASDPQRIRQLARETLAKGVSYELLNLLRQIIQKDQETGTQLVGDIIAKLKTENFATNNMAAHVAAGLLEWSRTRSAALGAMSTSDDSFSIVRLKLEDEQKQDLVDMLTSAALNATGPGSALQNIQYVMPEIEQYAPDRVARMKARIAEYNRTLPAEIRNWNNFSVQFEQATPEEMIKAAGKVADAQRAALFYQAAAKAVARGEADRYRELLKTQVEDEAERKRALEMLDNEQMSSDLRNGKTDELEKDLALIRNKEQRAIAMSRLAMLLEQKDQHDKAMKFLDEARTLVKVDLTNEAQSNALLAVMLGYALIEPAKAFGMIEPAIDHTNDQVAKLFLVDKVVKTGAIKDGELILNHPQQPLDYSFSQFAPGLTALGKADFDRTKALADRFQRNELKIIGRLLLARAMLRDSPKPANAEPR
jgi:hypothetical protein